MMSIAFIRVISLNIFVMSSDVRHLVGGFVFISMVDLLMYFSISFDSVW